VSGAVRSNEPRHSRVTPGARGAGVRHEERSSDGRSHRSAVVAPLGETRVSARGWRWSPRKTRFVRSVSPKIGVRFRRGSQPCCSCTSHRGRDRSPRRARGESHGPSSLLSGSESTSSDERLPAGASWRVAGLKAREVGVSPGKLMVRPRTASSPWQVRKRYEDCSGYGVSQTPSSNGRRARHDDPSCGQGRVQREHASRRRSLARSNRALGTMNHGVRSKSCWDSQVGTSRRSSVFAKGRLGIEGSAAKTQRPGGARFDSRPTRTRSQNHLDAWLRDFFERDVDQPGT
jgi:hypothetical protein